MAYAYLRLWRKENAFPRTSKSWPTFLKKGAVLRLVAFFWDARKAAERKTEVRKERKERDIDIESVIRLVIIILACYKLIL